MNQKKKLNNKKKRLKEGFVNELFTIEEFKEETEKIDNLIKNLEKNYKYIHNIEDILEKKHKIPIYREGRNYLEQYPIFLTFSYIFYKYVFPILFSICVTAKVIFNIINRLSLPFLIIYIVVSIFLIIINISYFTFNYKLRKGEKKNGKA